MPLAREGARLCHAALALGCAQGANDMARLVDRVLRELDVCEPPEAEDEVCAVGRGLGDGREELEDARDKVGRHARVGEELHGEAVVARVEGVEGAHGEAEGGREEEVVREAGGEVGRREDEREEVDARARCEGRRDGVRAGERREERGEVGRRRGREGERGCSV